MKKAILTIVMLSSSFAEAIDITDFGSLSFTIDSSTLFSTTQTQSDLRIVGTEINSLIGTFSSVDLSGIWGQPLNITASTVNSAPQNEFKITLFDSSLNEAEFIGGEWSSLIDGSLLTLSSFDGSFDTTNVIGLDLTGSGVIGSVDVTLNGLSMVPEPSTYALFAGIFTLGYIMIRRSRAKA